MNEKINNTLLDHLIDVHGDFEKIIGQMQDRNIEYPYDKVIELENKSYCISYNAISRMNNSLQEYNLEIKSNKEFFIGEKKIYLKYIMLYLVSIIMIKVFAKTLSSVKIDEIWYSLVGLVLGTANVSLINKNINEYRYGSKDRRELLNVVKSLEEDYNRDYEIAHNEIACMYSLNRNLLQELLHHMNLIKK